MVMHRDGERFLGVILADAMQVKVLLDLRGLGHMIDRPRLLDGGGVGDKFLVENIFAKDDAIIANIDTRSLDELFDFGM